MAGKTSKIQIASNALILLGHPPISSLSEPGAGVQAVANLYETSYQNMLTLTRWRFTVKKTQLSQLAAKPENEYSYQYQLPSDLLYLLRDVAGHDYEIYGDKLFSNHNSVNIDYQCRVDEAMLPSYFTKAFEFFLASQLAIPVTANSTRMAEYNAMYEKQLQRAFYLDASQRPSNMKPSSDYVDERL